MTFIAITPSPASESYLNVPRIISAAEITNCDAVHPGYGFLAESAKFAEICERCQLTFIGPAPATIRGVGDKALARTTMQEAGVPVVPGSDGPVADLDAARVAAEEVGYPLLLKASAGGGGRGMRRVRGPQGLQAAYEAASAEALAAFGNGEMYVERLALNHLHGDVTDALFESFGVDGDDIGMAQGRRGPRLAVEPLNGRSVAAEAARKDLQSDPAVQRDLPGLVDHAHAPGAEAAVQAEIAQLEIRFQADQ